MPCTHLPPPYLGHEPVGARVLLILEDNIRVVVGRQLLETLGGARYLALWSPAGPEGLLGYIGAELLVGERDEFLGEPPLAVASARSAALRGRCEVQQQEEDRGRAQGGGEREEGDPHRPAGGGERNSPEGDGDVFRVSRRRYPAPWCVTAAAA